MLQEIIKKTEKISLLVFSNEYDKTAQIIRAFISEFISFMPMIMNSYLREEMQEYREDMQYWPNEAEKILCLIDRRDRFALFDALYFELRNNLIAFANICENSGVEIR